MHKYFYGQNELQTYSVTLDVPTQITISAQNLTTGIYIYGIKYNGVIVKSKKLMIIK